MHGYISPHHKQLLKMLISMLAFNIVIGMSVMFFNLFLRFFRIRGLKSVDKNNHLLIVDLLCSLTQGLTSKWIMNKAQSTAIMAVQYAA
jgi:hypothetical protein